MWWSWCCCVRAEDDCDGELCWVQEGGWRDSSSDRVEKTTFGLGSNPLRHPNHAFCPSTLFPASIPSERLRRRDVAWHGKLVKSSPNCLFGHAARKRRHKLISKLGRSMEQRAENKTGATMRRRSEKSRREFGYRETPSTDFSRYLSLFRAAGGLVLVVGTRTVEKKIRIVE